MKAALILLKCCNEIFTAVIFANTSAYVLKPFLMFAGFGLTFFNRPNPE